MTAMYQKFSDEHGLAAVNTPEHNLGKYRKEMFRLEGVFNERFNTLFKMLTLGQHQLTTLFFETLASKVEQIFDIANSETEAWLKALMTPMETQVREHQHQLRQRFNSVSRIHAATETLDERIAELETQVSQTRNQLDNLARINSRISSALARDLDAAQPARMA
jgi:septal ring factor EnvC (AmiA/AmiB activator)